MLFFTFLKYPLMHIKLQMNGKTMPIKLSDMILQNKEKCIE